MTGIRDGKSISYDDFGQIELALPSIEEQKSISLFLQYNLPTVDCLISNRSYIKPWFSNNYRFQALSNLIINGESLGISSLVDLESNINNPYHSVGIDGSIPSDADINKATEIVGNQVKKIIEFRTNLISLAVTGNIG